MANEIKLGDRVQIFLDARVWGSDGWFNGRVVRIDPYTQHRSFYWVELDDDSAARLGKKDPPHFGAEPQEHPKNIIVF